MTTEPLLPFLPPLQGGGVSGPHIQPRRQRQHAAPVWPAAGAHHDNLRGVRRAAGAGTGVRGAGLLRNAACLPTIKTTMPCCAKRRHRPMPASSQAQAIPFMHL